MSGLLRVTDLAGQPDTRSEPVTPRPYGLPSAPEPTVPRGAWKSGHGGSRKWLPKQLQDRDGSGPAVVERERGAAQGPHGAAGLPGVLAALVSLRLEGCTERLVDVAALGASA